MRRAANISLQRANTALERRGSGAGAMGLLPCTHRVRETRAGATRSGGRLSRRQRGRLSRRQQEQAEGCLLLVVILAVLLIGFVAIGVATAYPRGIAVVLVVATFFVILIVRRRKQARLQAEEESRERARQLQALRQKQVRTLQAERQEEARQEEAAKQRRIEAMLHPDRVRDEIHYMSGPEFERFMADLLRQKGYQVEETPLSGDQGVDLVLPDLDGKRVVIQLKRWTGPVGNTPPPAPSPPIAPPHPDPPPTTPPPPP